MPLLGSWAHRQHIRAVDGHAGRDAIAPRIPMALWLMATIDGYGSARALEELCRQHLRYQWICGGVSVNYHSLSDFRTAHPQFLEGVLTESVATLLHQGLIDLTEVAQDGMRVRANAGADGNAGGQNNISTTGPNGGMGQRGHATTRPEPASGARAAQGENDWSVAWIAHNLLRALVLRQAKAG